MSPPPPPDSVGPADGLDWTGRIIGGRYRVDSVLGVGGMGTAYRAYDQKLERAVVLKVPHARHFSAGESRGRFQDEIRKLIAIEHPHVVRVYDVGDEDGIPYAVFPFLAGGSLGARMKALGARLTPDEVVPWLTQVADALDDLHARGDIHRDVKPDNILFDKPLGQGKANAYLADFGLAKALGIDPDRLFQSRTGVLIGTQAYMAPEQFSRRAPVTGAVDQYALATTVYQALSGRMPFAVSSSEELAVAKAIETPRPLSEVAKHVPAAVERTVMKALSADPKARFRTCAEFAKALSAGADVRPSRASMAPPVQTVEAPRAVSASLPVGAASPQPPRRATKPAPPAASAPPVHTRAGVDAPSLRRHSRAPLIVAVLLVVVGLGGAGWVVGWFGDRGAPARQHEPAEMPPTPVPAPAAESPAMDTPVLPPAMEAPPAGPVPTTTPAMDAEPAPTAMGADPVQVPPLPDAPSAVAPPWAKVAPEQVAEAKRLGVPVAFENSIGMKFVLVPAGTFLMGSPEEEKGRNPEEETQHRVALTKSFYMAIHETTNGQYRQLKSGHDSGAWVKGSLNGDTQPVVNVSHTDAVKFARWLSAQEAGRTYWLPSEAEWEYACRASAGTRFSFGDREEDLPRYGNYPDKNNSGGASRRDPNDSHGGPAPVGSFLPNGWGLYDMHGNVWEWCSDRYEKDYSGWFATDPTGPVAGNGRVQRGGGWQSSPASARAAARSARFPDERTTDAGFRLVVETRAALDPEAPPWAKVSAEQIAEAERMGIPVAFENSIGMKFVLVPPGTFTMGSPEEEKDRQLDERQHRVTLTKPFYMSIHETTNGQYRRFRKDHDSGKYKEESLSSELHPVVNVSHTDAVQFATWLAGQERGWAYRLPTEAEWEYAARAKTTASRYWGDDEGGFVRNANVADATNGLRFGEIDGLGSWADGYPATAPVGAFLPNGWGLYDMIGNVYEWCSDWYASEYPKGIATDPTGPASGTGHVLRGGSWRFLPSGARAAAREFNGPIDPVGHFGFRLVVPALPATKSGAPAWAKVALEQVAEAKRLAIPVAFENSIGMKFVLVPAGTFLMGSPEEEKGRNPEEETQHRVALTKSFYMAIHETTNGQYRRFKGDHDSGERSSQTLNGDPQPVVNVSHTDAVEFATWLSGQESGRTYRLPTESEWEYACRAGTTTRFSFGDRDEDLPRFGNFSDKNDPSGPGREDLDDGASVTAPVGRYAPNAWGLYDLHGNVWEWCADWKADYPTGSGTDPTGPASGTGRVLRGGSWVDFPDYARAASRFGSDPVVRDGVYGFRLVLPARASR